MKIATILFTYSRSWHTKQVLEALGDNYELPEKLFIFQDGLKKAGNREEWEQVNALIKKVSFCTTEIIISEENKGLAKSIISGINHVFQSYDAIIVLEDDCVPTKNFMGYMKQALQKYEDVKGVYSVTGFGYSSEIKNEGYDAYFVGRESSWGWGTWKDRWINFPFNSTILNEILSSELKSRNLSIWGNDLPAMLANQQKGRNDSWAVYWALHIINRRGFCVAPCVSLIKNIGMDGTGVHCGVTHSFDVVTENECKKTYNFPEKLDFSKTASSYFIKHFGGYTAYNNDIKKTHIIVYGLGSYYMRNEKYFCDNYYIECFIDRKKKGYYAGKKIIQVDDIQNYPNCRIFILLIDIEENKKIANLLIENYGIEREKISCINI